MNDRPDELVDRERNALVSLTLVEEMIRKHEQYPSVDSPEALAILRLQRNGWLKELGIIHRAMKHDT